MNPFRDLASTLRAGEQLHDELRALAAAPIVPGAGPKFTTNVSSLTALQAALYKPDAIICDPCWFAPRCPNVGRATMCGSLLPVYPQPVSAHRTR